MEFTKKSSFVIESFLPPFLPINSTHLDGIAKMEERILYNISYGSHPEQIMDVYLPEGRHESITKVILLIHGGRWTEGSKERMNEYIPWLRSSFPLNAIANMGYRLATVESPGIPKQIEDVGSGIEFLSSNQGQFQILPKFGLFGRSSGSHLAMLYAFSIDKGARVNAIVNLVGHVNFADPAFLEVHRFMDKMKTVVGDISEGEFAGKLAAVSPVNFISRQSPKTISFYGGRDPLIPITQGPLLEDTLDAAGIFNKYYMYPDEGHGFINPPNLAHMRKKIEFFFRNYL